MTETPSHLPDPAQLKKIFEDWWGTASTIVASIVSALTALKLDSPVAYGIAVPLTVACLAAAVVMYRRDIARQRMRSATGQTAVATFSGSAAGAFRRLRRFRRGETLPAHYDGVMDADLLVPVIQPGFKLAIVTGDRRSWKRSLLECALLDWPRAGRVCSSISAKSDAIYCVWAGWIKTENRLRSTNRRD